MAFKAAFNGEAEIVATFICGDNYCANHLDDVAAHMVETVKAYGADGLIAGPAFNAGRYGTACGAVCAAVAKEVQLPVVSGMYRESPGRRLVPQGSDHRRNSRQRPGHGQGRARHGRRHAQAAQGRGNRRS